jgi:hypothetical protein
VDLRKTTWTLMLATTMALALAWTAFGSATHQTHTIHVVVPIDRVTASEGTGVSFRESYIPRGKSKVVRQDAFGIGTFKGEGLFLGAITLHGGQIIYGGATTNQDDNVYAILGGTKTYADTRGTVTLHPISSKQVAITIKTT